MTAQGDVSIALPGTGIRAAARSPTSCAPAFVGTLPGLTLGLTAGALTAKRAPNYGRVALIQSAALGGAIFGAAAQLAFKWRPYGTSWEYTVHRRPYSMPRTMPICWIRSAECSSLMHDVQHGLATSTVPSRTTSVFDLAPGALIGLNVGLAAGLLGAYLPDQSRYGPSWKRMLLIDLGAGAGALAGGVGSCVALVDDCLKAPDAACRRARDLGVGGDRGRRPRRSGRHPADARHG